MRGIKKEISCNQEISFFLLNLGVLSYKVFPGNHVQVRIISCYLPSLFQLIKKMAAQVYDNRTFGLIPDTVRVLPTE